MRDDLWIAAGFALYLGFVVTLTLGVFVSPWIAAVQAVVIGSMLGFAWFTK
jgi:hypothetical protein